MPTNSTAKPALDDAIQSAANSSRAHMDEALGEFKSRAGKVAQETLKSLRANAGPYVDDAGEHFATAERYLVERVQKQPLTTSLALLGVGVLVGLLLSGGRSR